jgi:hypothetical protein
MGRAQASSRCTPTSRRRRGGSDGGAGLRLINQFAASYVPRRQNLESEAQLERFLDRVAQVLETFAKGFIELRRGYEAFSEEMGVGSVTRCRSPHRFVIDRRWQTAVRRAASARNGC